MSRTFRVEMWAVCLGRLKEIEIPNLPKNTSKEKILEKIYTAGQEPQEGEKKTDFTPLSVGDVILLDGEEDEKYLICEKGFQKLSKEDYVHVYQKIQVACHRALMECMPPMPEEVEASSSTQKAAPKSKKGK